MTIEEITRENLAQFTGTETYTRHHLARRMVYTDGVGFLVQNGAAWLVDLIASHVAYTKALRGQGFVSVKFKRNKEGRHAVVLFDDGDGYVLASQEIEYTDFPLPEITLFLELGSVFVQKVKDFEPVYILMLPSER